MEKNVFTDKKVWKVYMSFALPLVLSKVVSMIYNLVDTFFVAQTNNVDLVAGVSIGAPVFTLLMAVGNIFGQGGSSLIARLYGENARDDIRHVSSFCFYSALGAGIIIAAFMLIFRDNLVFALGADSNSFSYARDYFTWLAIGAPVIILAFIHSNFLRSEGMSTLSMTGTVSGAVINIILDPILISVAGLGAAGAAMATVIGYLFAVVFHGIVVLKKSSALSMNLSRIIINRQYWGQIFGIGISAAVVNVLASVSIIIVNHFLLPYGNEKIAAMGIALKVVSIVQMVFVGLAFGSQPVYGYYYGKKDKKRLKELLRFTLKFIVTVAAVLTLAVLLAAKPIMNTFINNGDIISSGVKMLRWQVVSMPLAGGILIITIICQAFGKTFPAMILSFCRQGIVFFAVLFLANQLFGYIGVIASQCVADVITAIIVFFIYLKFLRSEFTGSNFSIEY